MSMQRQFLPTRAKSFRQGTSNGPSIISDSHLRRLDLTAANLIAMFTTPISLLPAGATGNNYGLAEVDCYLIERVLLVMTPGSVAFTGGGTVNLQFHTTTSSVPHAGTIPASIITATANSAQTYTHLGGNVGANGLVVPGGEGVDITNGSGVFAAGNGKASMFVWFKTLRF